MVVCADEYYYRMPDGDQKGPVTLAQLNEWVTHGLLGDKIMVGGVSSRG